MPKPGFSSATTAHRLHSMSLLKLSNQHAASFLDGLNLKLGGAGHSCLPLQARILIKAETGASCRNHEPKGILKSFSK